jgi:hypothetical protein
MSRTTKKTNDDFKKVKKVGAKYRTQPRNEAVATHFVGSGSTVTRYFDGVSSFAS